MRSCLAKIFGKITKNMSKIKYEFTPFDEDQLEAAVNRLAFIMANRMGWIPKKLAKKKGKYQDSDNEDKTND